MKLKYYLRGVGIGIIFATLVMTVSSFVHKYNISDEYIIKEARKLGMVMKEELSGNNGLFGNGDFQETENTQAMEENTQATEENVTEEIKDTSSQEQIPGSENESQSPVESETPVVSETPVESETPVASETPVESETPVASETPVEPEPPVESETKTYVTIIVEYGDSAKQVADKAKAAGLVDDADAFRIYIRDHGYSYDLRVGKHEIPLGATYEEICRILNSESKG